MLRIFTNHFFLLDDSLSTTISWVLTTMDRALYFFLSNFVLSATEIPRRVADFTRTSWWKSQMSPVAKGADWGHFSSQGDVKILFFLREWWWDDHRKIGLNQQSDCDLSTKNGDWTRKHRVLSLMDQLSGGIQQERGATISANLGKG